MKKVEILHEFNSLIVAGFSESGIDIIQESLENKSSDSDMLSALGRFYLLEKKPDQAGKYFQLSLSKSCSGFNKNDTNELYKFDDFTHIKQSANSAEKINVDTCNDLFTSSSTSTISSEDRQCDLSKNEEGISIDQLVNDEEEYPLIIPGCEDVLTENELNWNNLDEFDEINDPENIDLHFRNEVETTGKLNRFEKAQQISAEVIQAHDWGKENISLLEQVFLENGWGIARVSIERELKQGLIPEELELALFFRQLWTENPQFWISFIHITSNRPGQETRASYKKMSWTESLRIIRSFNDLPSEDELQHFIYQIYDDWYCSTALQRQFKAFFKYVKYRTGLGRRSLPGNEIFSFVDSFYQESL